MGKKELLYTVPVVLGIITSGAYLANEMTQQESSHLCQKTESEGNLEKDARERLNGVIKFMDSCQITQFRYASERFWVLAQTDYLVIGDTPLYVKEPAGIQLDYGSEGGSSLYNIHVSEETLKGDLFNDADLAVYFFRALIMYEEVSKIEGTAADKTYIDRRNLEARAWANTYNILGDRLMGQIADNTIKSNYLKFIALGEEEFIKYWENSPELSSLPKIYR